MNMLKTWREKTLLVALYAEDFELTPSLSGVGGISTVALENQLTDLQREQAEQLVKWTGMDEMHDPQDRPHQGK